MITWEMLKAKAAPFNVRYVGGEGSKGPGVPLTVKGFGNAGLHPICNGVRDTVVHFTGGGWIWMPDFLNMYEIVEGATFPQAVAALKDYDFSRFPGLYDLMPWAELESAVACEHNPEEYLK